MDPGPPAVPRAADRQAGRRSTRSKTFRQILISVDDVVWKKSAAGRFHIRSKPTDRPVGNMDARRRIRERINWCGFRSARSMTPDGKTFQGGHSNFETRRDANDPHHFAALDRDPTDIELEARATLVKLAATKRSAGRLITLGPPMTPRRRATIHNNAQETIFEATKPSAAPSPSTLVRQCFSKTTPASSRRTSRSRLFPKSETHQPPPRALEPYADQHPASAPSSTTRPWEPQMVAKPICNTDVSFCSADSRR